VQDALLQRSFAEVVVHGSSGLTHLGSEHLTTEMTAPPLPLVAFALRGVRPAIRSSVARPAWKGVEVAVDDAPHLSQHWMGFRRQRSDSAPSPRRRTWASLVRRGRKHSSRRRSMVAADGSTTVRGRLDRRLQHFASTGERAWDASGGGKSNGPLSAGGVEREADDAGSHTAVGRREQGLLPRARPRAAIACRGGDRMMLGASGRNDFRFGLCGGV
jgi:hypothetical protein